MKKIVFLTGTRADYGKLKPLMLAVDKCKEFALHIFVTGMHMLPQYGQTEIEVRNAGFKNIFPYINQFSGDSMDVVLAHSILGIGRYLELLQADLLVVHGDRVEALAGAVVGALNNIRVAHIEGGEVSGTIDESLRHSISKLAHIHFVANQEAKKRLIQMGECEDDIYVVGSPDIDLMTSESLPSLQEVKKYYGIDFDDFALAIFHPVTTSLATMQEEAQHYINALRESKLNYIAIYPNNDLGSEIILNLLKGLLGNKKFKIFSSLRFEYFLVLLKNAQFIIGNSSAGVREAPFYGVPTINIGNRQHGRFFHQTIVNAVPKKKSILDAISATGNIKRIPSTHFGDGKSTERFIKILKDGKIFKTKIQKHFVDSD